MKKLFYTFVLALVTSLAISSCTEDNVKPRDSGNTTDKCAFGGPGCK